MTQDLAIRVSNLSKVYNLSHQNTQTVKDLLKDAFDSILKKRPPLGNTQFTALANVSFELKKGEVLGIIGRNGAGKSTLLRILGEVTEPSEGTIEINGKIASILDIGTGFHPELSGRDNVFLSGSLLGMAKEEIESRFDEIVEFSGIGKFIDIPVKRYSNGMFIRLAFSVVSHLDAEIILLDEVLSVGDSEFSLKSFNKIRDLLRKGRSVIIVSHDLGSIANLCTKALILDKGSIKAFGSPVELVGTYLERTLLHKGKWEDQFSNETAGPSQSLEWSDMKSAPGNEHIRLRRLQVCAVGKGPQDKICMEDDIRIEMEYEKNDDDPSILAFIINQKVNDPLISITPFRANERRDVDGNFAAGIYRTTCLFPGKQFNMGLFTLDILFVSWDHVALMELKQAISFRIYNVPNLNDRFVYNGKFPGPMIPFLDWRHEYLGKSTTTMV